MKRNSYFIRYKVNKGKYKGHEYMWAFDLIVERGTVANYIMHRIIDEVKNRLSDKTVRDNQIEFICIALINSEKV